MDASSVDVDDMADQKPMQYIVEGKNKCGTTATGEPQTMSVGAWIWMFILILSAAGQLVALLIGKDTEGRPMPVESPNWGAAFGVLVVSLVNMYIIYMHAQNCNALTGFAVTFLISILCSMLACVMAPARRRSAARDANSWSL